MLKRISAVLSWVMVVFWVGFAALALVYTMAARKSPTGPELFGVRFMVVLSDSMAPRIRAGDLIIASKPNPATLKVGDIVTYRDASGSRLITHRIIGRTEEQDGPVFTMKGDNNNVPDNRLIHAKDVAGIFRARIPYGGYVTDFARSWTGWLVLIILPAAALGFSEFRRLARGSAAEK